MHISDDHKQWANYLKDIAGGDAAVTTYCDKENNNKAPIFTSENTDGILAATVGLMDFDQSRNPASKVYTEILMDKRDSDDRVGSILSTIAFCVMKEGWKVAPGAIFKNILTYHVPGTRFPHVMFAAPFQWDGLSIVKLQGKTIYPLVAIPISEAESQFVTFDASKILKRLWIETNVDILDWRRASAA